MPDRRIHIPKEHEELVNRLCNANDDEYNGPFKLKADVLAFAAAYGASLGKSTPLKETVKDPIRSGVFDTTGYGTLIKLLAVSHTEDPNILAITDEMEDKRATIFEEYANGGLALLAKECSNDSNLSNAVLLIINQAKPRDPDQGLDITNLI
jgi:dnd system-associated protein 4